MTEANRRKKIMIVDDSPVVLAVTRFTLESAGYEVVTHPRPSGSITLILQEAPDLLLVDVNMPGLNGDSLVKMLGSTQSNNETVVLLHSSLSDEVLAQKVKSSHAHGYIRKTDNQQALIRSINRWLRPGSASGNHAIRANLMDVPDRSSDSRTAASGKLEIAGDAGCSGKVLLVDHEMVKLSDLRRLLVSQPCTVEFALSGKETLRRLQGESPPDVVVLGWLEATPSCDDVIREALRLSPRWKSRLIVVHDNKIDARLNQQVTRIPCPITEAALRGAIQNCLKLAS